VACAAAVVGFISVYVSQEKKCFFVSSFERREGAAAYLVGWLPI
jgi:hypothetical protein